MSDVIAGPHLLLAPLLKRMAMRNPERSGSERHLSARAKVTVVAHLSSMSPRPLGPAAPRLVGDPGTSVSREDDDTEIILLRYSFDEFGQLKGGGRVEQIDRRIGIDDAPVTGRRLGEGELGEGREARVRGRAQPLSLKSSFAVSSAIWTACIDSKFCIGVGMSPESPATVDGLCRSNPPHVVHRKDRRRLSSPRQ